MRRKCRDFPYIPRFHTYIASRIVHIPPTDETFLTILKSILTYHTFDCVDHNKLWKVLKESRIPDHLACFLRNLYAGQEETVRSWHGTTDWFQMGKEYVKAVNIHPLISLICRVHHETCWTGWSTSWNQDCWEKYQQRQICRWHHPYGRKRIRTKEPLDESERGEWKSCLKTQHSENKDHGIQAHHFMANRCGNNGNSERFYFGGLQNHCRWWLQPWN